MRFFVRHRTLYRYSVPIRLAPHVLRLTPRTPGGFRARQELLVDPLPWSRRDSIDDFGNGLITLEFPDMATDHLSIESRFEIEVPPPPAPVGLFLPPLPWWGAFAGAEFAPYLGDSAPEPAVAAFAEGLLADVGGDALAFLRHLNHTLYTRTDRRVRLEGDARSPAETLATATGACRDLTVLFMACCRGFGIPARFVSGYQAEAESVDGQRHLHAWPEVLLPGFGWTGFDPTHGLPVSDGHVALCAAPGQEATMPVEGGYWFDGTVITSTLDYTVEIDTRR